MDAVFDDDNIKEEDEGATNADTVSVRAAAPSNANVGNFIVSSNSGACNRWCDGLVAVL